METKARIEGGLWNFLRTRIPTGRLFGFAAAAEALAATFLFLPLAGRAGGVVTATTEAALRAAMAGGGTVTFACDGMITLATTITNEVNTLLDGSGHQIAISGGGDVRVFSVSTNVSFTILNLAIINGLSTNDGGGGILNDGGTLNATNCALLGNRASDSPGSLTFAGSPFSGGAIYNGGWLNASACRFVQNLAVGGRGISGIFGNEFFSPGPGNPGGSGSGGAIYNAGTMFIERTLFASNTVTGGMGGAGGDGTMVFILTAAAQTGGHGGLGGDGNGGALFNGGKAVLVNCTFAVNTAIGGTGGRGGNGGVLIYNGRPSDYPGGDGGSGGSGFGAVCDVTGLLHFTNCTVAGNSAGAGGGGSGGMGPPGGLGGPNGSAWGGVKSSGSSVSNTLLATNSPGGNWLGMVIDLGHNLSSDLSCLFTNSGSLNACDPILAPLRDNGGPTLTMALLPGSPAIDAADSSAAPATDQRGVLRPVGPNSDIGAFEYGLPAVLRISGSHGTGLDILASAYPGQPCRLLTSSNWSNWIPIATNQIGPDGTVCFQCDRSEPCRFYRLVIP
jgi:hypothetical protein